MNYAAETQAAFDRAHERVEQSPELKPYSDVILDEWDNTGTLAEHYTWVATAPIKEILEWATSIAEELAELEAAEKEDAIE